MIEYNLIDDDDAERLLALDDLSAIDELQPAAEINQQQYQYDNVFITAYTATDGGIVLALCLLSDNEYYHVAETNADVDAVVRGLAENVADNSDDVQIEQYRWGLRELCDEVDGDFTGRCMVVVNRTYFGCVYPIDWLCDDYGDPVIFDDYYAAAATVSSLDDEIYVTAHNEASRPSYYIVRED